MASVPLDGDLPVEETPDGGAIVTLDGPATPLAGPQFGDDDSPNLVVDFIKTDAGKKALEKISADVIRKFDADWSGSEKYRQRIADDHKVLYGELEPKDVPFRGCSNAHVPSTLENMTRITARLESEIFGDWTSVFGVMPVGVAGDAMAQALTMYGNWQIREKLDDFPRQMSRAVLSFMMDGDVTAHSYWDAMRRVPVTEILTPDEFVTPFTFTTTRPDYSDLPHYTKIFRKYRHELEAMRDAWHDVDVVLEGREPSFDDEPDQTLREARRQIEEIEPPDDGADAPYKLLHHEGWMKLPGRDKQRWCQAIVDPVSKAILCLTIHEEVNWQDKLRFERQSAEAATYQQMQVAHVQMMGQYQQALDTHQQAAGVAQAAQAAHDQALPEMAPQQAAVAGGRLQMLHSQVPPHPGEPPMPPSPPPWMAGGQTVPAPPRRDPIYMFSHGVCIESLVGNLGLSFGRIQADLNRAQDVALSQFIDAATLANGGMWLTTDAFEEDNPIEFKPGAVIRVPGIPAGQLSANIMPVQFPPANQQLLEAVKAFGDMAQSSLQAPAVLSGEPGKSGETYRGISSRIEQATKQLSVPARAFCRFLKQILRNLARLNAVYLDEEEVASVLNQNTGQFEQIQATRDMFAQNYQVTINSDLRFASQTQRISEADEILAMVGQFPPLQMNPDFQYYAMVKALLARGRADVIPHLGAAPAPQPMFGVPHPMLMAMAPPGGAPPQGQKGPSPNGPPGEQGPGPDGEKQTPPPGAGPPPNAPHPPRPPSPPAPSQPAAPPG